MAARDVVFATKEESGQQVEELRVDGGASANEFRMQFQADILGVAAPRTAGAGGAGGSGQNRNGLGGGARSARGHDVRSSPPYPRASSHSATTDQPCSWPSRVMVAR